MIPIFLNMQESYRTKLIHELKSLNQPPISFEFHQFQTPFQSACDYNVIFCEIKDETMMLELKRIKEVYGSIPIILLTNDPLLLNAYASLRLFGWIITCNWEESMRALLPALQEELTLYSCSIHYHSKFLDVTIHPNRILYIESYRHDLSIHTDTMKLNVRGVLKDYHIENSYVHLIQVHKSYIVNLRKVKEIKGNEVILNNAVSIPIGNAYKPQVNEVVAKYLCKGYK